MLQKFFNVLNSQRKSYEITMQTSRKSQNKLLLNLIVLNVKLSIVFDLLNQLLLLLLLVTVK